MKVAKPDVQLPALEAQIRAFWDEKKIFQQSLENRKSNPSYRFYDGPPFATGTPHYGHLLAGTIKDIVPRYQTMKGFYVERRFGWDTHGLPIEMIVEKSLDLKGRTDVLNYGVAKFNEECRANVFKFVAEWRQVNGQLGRWVDFDNDYKTLDVSFMESVWWVFKRLWDAGRIYEGMRVMPYSWRLTTPLSNFEAGSNYKTVQDPAVTVRFKLNDKPGCSLIVWTTTPWSLISNLAACVGPEIDYVEIKLSDGEHLILAEARLGAYFKSKDEYEIVKTYKGTDLAGLTYEPVFPYFNDEKKKGAFKVLVDSYVTTEDGTGVVSQAPAYGEDDYRICKANGIEIVDALDKEGNFTEVITEFAGKNFKESEKGIVQRLKSDGLLYKQEMYSHSYPFCDRSDTPLIYRAISAWYVKVEDLRESMVKNNDTIHWVPEYIKEGRFGNWLANARDWNISRNRFWGNPLPVWRCSGCGALECLGSKAELEEKSGTKVNDLHKHFVDELTWSCASCSGEMRRIPEVLDCWFESGAMPYAQIHYPFENKEVFEKGFPADFIAEGLDQTRGWFYTLMVLSTALFDKPPFKNCVVNGMILAEDGKKMSKRLKNYPDPSDVMKNYGADALRLYLVNSPAVRAEPLRFSENGVKEIVRQALLPFWNVYSFFTTYASVDGYTPSAQMIPSTNTLDQWIVSRLQTLLTSIEKEMAEYRLYAVLPALLEFVEELTNWYVRRSRRRFWSDDLQDKRQGYDTLYSVLVKLSQALAPFIPFITDEVYRNLSSLTPGAPESVHLTDYPVANGSLIDAQLERDMSLIMKAVGLGRSLRSKEKIKVRQPLSSITVITRNEDDARVLREYGSHITEELNVKNVVFSSHEEEYVDISIKPNFPVLGPIFGKNMGEVSKAIGGLSRQEILALEDGGSITIAGHVLTASSFLIGRKPKNNQSIETAAGVTVLFDTTLTPELISEGLAREFVNRIQRMRKEADLHISDRIAVRYHAPQELVQSLALQQEYIKAETLSTELADESTPPEQGQLVANEEIDEWKVTIAISRVG